MAHQILTPTNYLLNRYVLIALGITFINDHYLKVNFPGIVTGKLSDFSGLFYFPFFAAALTEIISKRSIKFEIINKKEFILIMLVTDLLFILLKLTDLRTVFVYEFSKLFFSISITPDKSDLVAILSNLPAYYLAQNYFSRDESY